MPDRPTMPPPGVPVPSFNAPPHIEATWVEKIDITTTGYTKLERGTLYEDVVGASQQIIDAHPGLFLLREIASPNSFPFSYRYWGLGETFTTQTIGEPNLTPAKYRRLIRTVETDQPVDIGYTFPAGLTGDQTQVQKQQETIEEARLRIIQEIINLGDSLVGGDLQDFGRVVINETVVDEGELPDETSDVITSSVTPFGNGKAIKITARYAASLPISLTQSDTNEAKQEVTVTRTLQAAGDSVPAPTATSDVKSTSIAGRQTIVEQRDVPEVFDAKSRSIGTPIVIPERFRAASGLETAEDTIEGTVPDTISLGTNEVERQEAAQTELTKRVRTTAFDPSIASPLHGQDYDESDDIAIPYEERLETTGTSLGRPRTTVTPLSDRLDLAREIDLAALEELYDNYVRIFSGTTNINFPNELTGINAFDSVQSGEGDDDDLAGSASITNAGSWVLSPRSTAHASISVNFDIDPKIRQTSGQTVDVTHVMFLMKSPVTRTAAMLKLSQLMSGTVQRWPRFNEESVTIFCVSGEGSVQVRAAATYRIGFNDCSDCHTSEAAASTGTGVSRSLAISVKAVRIPPTIHKAIGVSGNIGDTYNVTATADADAYAVSATKTDSVYVEGFVTPQTIGATPGATEIPSTGLWLLNLDPGPYKLDYIRFHAEILNLNEGEADLGGPD